MEELADKTAAILATRSSRRRFLRLVGTTALGVGVWLTRSGVSLAGCRLAERS